VFAENFSRCALEAFAREYAPTIRLSLAEMAPGDALDDSAVLLAEKVGRDAAGLPLLEGLHVVTGLYPALLPTAYRAAHGAFYTPPALSSRLLDLATDGGVDWRTARVLDPAAGGGTFLVQAAMRMSRALADCEPPLALAKIGSRIRGFELDRHAAALAQGAVEIALADLSAACSRPVPQVVLVRDTLEEPAEERFDLVVGNPPYGRVTLTDEQRRRYARSLYGHANLYGVFSDIALRWARPNGLVAYLTPTSFLAGQYYSALRGLLAREAPPIAIDFVHARRGVFDDVLQETLLAVYRKDESSRRAQIHYLRVRNENEADVETNGIVALPANPTSPWLVPRAPEHGRLIKRIETIPSRLSDWGYSVSTGPLVWNRHKAQLRETPEGRGVHPLIWAEAVGVDGKFAFKAKKRNHVPYFQLQSGDEWLLVRAGCVLVQRTTAKEQARRIIAAELPAKFVARHRGVVVENHLNMIRATGAARVPPTLVAAILNSRVVDDIFRCMNGSVAVSAFELEALPLPAVGDLGALHGLVRDRADRTIIEAECERLYRGQT
jgi:adenine-specific DNA-methyltransferase